MMSSSITFNMDYLCYSISELIHSGIDESVLTEEEKAFPPQRRMARALLRAELARRLHLPADKIIITHNEHGKPLVNGICFNLSHSADLLSLAFHHADIGVDIQQEHPLRSLHHLAPRIMCEQQLEHFRKNGENAAEFFTCWSIAEALVKLHGSTIWQALDYPFILHSNRVELPDSAQTEVELFTPRPGYYGAVAYRKPS